MNINEILEAFYKGTSRDIGSVEQIIALLLAILGMSIYEFFVYRLISKRNYYNKSMHISLMVIPFFIGAIVAALQSNLVITLGTIGALAIIRYRSAIKDPIDMVYIFWSVFIGISCGCQLYKLCVLTSVTVTVVLLIIELLSGKILASPYILVINSKNDNEDEINIVIKKYSKNYRIKSRNFTSNGCDYIYEVNSKTIKELLVELNSIETIKQFSLLEFDNEDAI